MSAQSAMRDIKNWAENNGRTAGMVVFAVLLLGVVGFIYRPKSHEMIVFHRYNSGNNMLVFNFDQEYEVRSIEICSLDEEAKPAEVLWRLVPGVPEGQDPEKELLKPIDTVRYGGRPRGMIKETEGRVPKLEAGVTYRLRVVAKGGKADYDFAVNPPEQRRRG